MKKPLLSILLAYLLWGAVLPSYLKLFSGYNSFYVLCSRILWSLLLCTALIFATGRAKKLPELFKNERGRFLAAGFNGFTVAANWGIYIWAINRGHVLDASLGYYIQPLVIFIISAVVFREKLNKAQLAAIALAALGVVVLTVGLGTLPVVALSLAITFSAYGTIKKLHGVKTIESLFLETAFTAPIALCFCAYCAVSGTGALAASGAAGVPLLLGLGLITALPLLLYSYSLNGLPYSIVGFMQYITPTFLLFTGVLAGEKLTVWHGIALPCIWAGFALFMFTSIRADKHS